MNTKGIALLACVLLVGCKSTPTATSPAQSTVMTSLPSEIAVSASANFYSIIATAGLPGAITAIKSCYDGVKERDNFLFCLSMDMQAQRFNDTMSKRMGVAGDAYYEQDYFDDRLLVLERWYPAKSQLDYALKQVMAGLEQGTKNEVARIEGLKKKQ